MKINKSIIAGLGLFALPIILQAQLLVESEPAQTDSIVQLTADAYGLPSVTREDLPRTGTFWEVLSGGIMAPLPAPPGDASLPIYQLANGSFLVDATGGKISVRGGSVTSETLAAAVEAQGNAVADLIERSLAVSLTGDSLMMSTMELQPLEAGGGSYTPMNFSSSVDYGTNLWLASTGVTNGYLTGRGSNTVADVQYEIQSRTNLMQTDWQFEDFIYGSALTNWTPLSVAQNGRKNLFIRLLSWASSDGSGLPDWWQQQYGVTDPYGDPDGDGWNNLQEFQNGTVPNSFNTPPTPTGILTAYNPDTKIAKISWLPSPGPVTSYTVTDSAGNTFNFPAGTTSFQTTATNVSENYYGDPTVYRSYQVQANYAGGGSGLSNPKPLQPVTAIGTIIPGPSQAAYLTLIDLPETAVKVRLTLLFEQFFRINSTVERVTYTTNRDILVSVLNNGMFPLPADWLTVEINAPDPNATPYSGIRFRGFVQSLDTSGNASGAEQTWVKFNPGSPNEQFYDGRRQLKQNLAFQLRAAPRNGALHFSITGRYQEHGVYSYPTDYAYADYYNFANLYSYNNVFETVEVESQWPFIENHLFRNFVFSPGDIDETGALTTGVMRDSLGLDYIEIDSDVQWPTYWHDPGSTNLPAILDGAQTRWLFYDQFGVADGVAGEANIIQAELGADDWIVSMDGAARNWFGLPYLSSMIANVSWPGGQLTTNVLAAGNSAALSIDYYPDNIYPETAQPQFQTVEYDFWNPNLGYYTFEGNDPNDGYWDWHQTELLPGQSGFSIGNHSNSNLMVEVGGSIQVAGYAKLAVQNGYAAVYGYLGQYFDQAYKMDENGNVTTNTTGVLSPYGDFYATEPGPTALVTMPDLDTGERGTGIVHVVSLQVDKNHDGEMDWSFNGPDATSQASPMVFWRNNNFDRLLLDEDDDAYYEDGLNPINVAGLPRYERVPDFNYTNFTGNRAIPTKRDLEDFTRLWACGITSNLLTALPSGSSVKLSWGSIVSGNPAIDLFKATDSDGGTGYLTNAASANAQTNRSQGVYVGRLAADDSIQLNSPFFPSLWAGDRFIWCGASNGVGALTLTIADAQSNVLAQSSVWIEIKDIKQMYERWTIGDNPNVEPLPVALKAANDLAVNGLTVPFEYDSPQDTNTPYILFVHGWNMRTEDKDIFAETAFKRLYWQGYQGRFGSFRWPTDYGFSGFTSSAHNPATDPRNFDRSEFQAWKSGVGLKNMLTRLNILYTNNVFLMAHSMGNIVAGEALKQAGNNQLVNTYVSMQGAVASHAYDPGTPWRTIPYLLDSGTLERYTMYWTNGASCYFNSSAGAGTYVNFYNTNDYALDKWQINQNLKPDSGYNMVPGELYFYTPLVGSSRQLFFPADTYEIFSYITEARCYALGAQADVEGSFNNFQVNLPSVWPPDSFTADPSKKYSFHFWHSAQFRGDLTQEMNFWRTLLGSQAFNLK